MAENDENPQEKEWSVFGFVTSRLRTGFITAAFGLLIAAIVSQEMRIRQLNDRELMTKEEKLILQDSLYREMIKIFRPAVQTMVNKVDSSTKKIDSARVVFQNKMNTK